jgi:hypothetical protein
MRFSPVLLFLLVLAPLASAQAPVPAGGAPQPGVAAGDAAPAVASVPDDWRDTTGYTFPAVAQTVADLQNLAYAMQLRDYCANRRVPDAFVRQQLAQFSAITGRVETCRSLLAY